MTITSTAVQENALFTKIMDGSQKGKEGTVHLEEVKAICKHLSALSPKTINFNENRINRNEEGVPALKGGTCSAMSLDFLSEYLSNRNSACIGEHLTFETIKDILTSIGTQYAQSSAIFRTRQVAYNTIEKNSLHTPIDLKKDKVESLARFHALQVVYASDTIDFASETEEAIKSKLACSLKKLPWGIHFIRAIVHSKNHKEEAYGHSMGLIKEKAGIFFYNPNEGIYRLKDNMAHEALFNRLNASYIKFKTPLHRIYHLNSKI